MKQRSDGSSTASDSADSDGSATSGDSGDASSSGSDDDGCVRGRVDISCQRLQSMHAVASNKDVSTPSKYAGNGKSKTRIQDCLKHPKCKCKCSVPFALLLRVCVAFWLLTKRGQDTVLWTIQQEEPGTGSKRDWFIEGLRGPDISSIFCSLSNITSVKQT